MATGGAVPHAHDSSGESRQTGLWRSPTSVRCIARSSPRSIFGRCRRSLRRLGWGGQRDVVRRAFAADYERTDAVLHLTIRFRGPIMLAEMLRPRFHQPTLHTASRVSGIHEQLPEDGAIAAAKRPQLAAHGIDKDGALFRFDDVLDRHEHRPGFGVEVFGHDGIGPVL